MLRAAALLAVLALPAHAQSPFSYTNRAGSGPTQAGDPIKLNEATAAGAGKAAQRGGALADPDGNTVVRLGNAGTNPTWYPRTGSRQYGGTVVESSPWGFGNQAGTLGIYTNQTQQQTDYGCSAGGFGENMENRGYAGLSDTVSICHLVNSLVPLATLHHGADFALTNDPSTAVPQYYTLAEGGVHNLTGIPSQDTQINFASPLTPSVVAALKPNMFVRTSTGWTGFVTTWDPAGAWLKVDAWVALVNPGVGNGTTAYVGYNPLAPWTSPTGAPGTSMTLYINAMQNTYGINGILNHVAGSYCLFGFGCSAEYMEVGTANNVMPFTRSEYNWFSDQPRDVVQLLGAGGRWPISSVIAIQGANTDKGITVTEGQYAAILIQPVGNYGLGDGYMSQQTKNNAFSIKHNGPGYIYQVDAAYGTINQGAQGIPSVSSMRGTLSVQSGSSATVTMTADGASVAPNGANQIVSIPPNSTVNVVSELQVSNNSDGGRQIAMQIRCLYRRVGTAAPTLAQSVGIPELPNTPTAGYNAACNLDTANSFGGLAVQQSKGGSANWAASFDATINPL